MANSKQFEGNDMTVVIGGKIITGLVAIEFEMKQDKEVVYGRGSKPLAIQSGKKSYEGSVTLLQSEYNALLRAAKALNPSYGITDIAFDIIWNFTRTIDSAEETYTIVSAEFTSEKLGMKTEDKWAEIDLPFLALDIILA